MSDRLTSTIAEIAQRIRAGEYNSEAEISRGIILRILNELNWPVFDMQVVVPEFKIENRKVDYALCQSPGKAVILIEVKDLGKADNKGEKQLFQYAFNHGVPVAILTDGQNWRFFLPAGVGTYEDRCFATVDLLKDDKNKCAEEFALNLDQGAVFSGQAWKYAHRTYEARKNQRAAEAKYNNVWRKLVAGPDPQLLELFSREVERQSGIKPDRERVAGYIRSQSTFGSPPATRRPKTTESKPPIGPRPGPPVSTGKCSFTYGGRTENFKTGADLIAGVFSLLAKLDRDFVQRYSEQYPGKKYPVIAPSRDQLYPDNPKLRGSSRKLYGGWWIRTHSDSKSKLKRIRQACELAGIEFDRDIVVVMPIGRKKKRS